jgi:hypothetical protein
VLRDAGHLAMGGQIVDATVIQARRPRLSKDEKATVKGGAMPAGWSKAKRAQMESRRRAESRDRPDCKKVEDARRRAASQHRDHADLEMEHGHDRRQRQDQGGRIDRGEDGHVERHAEAFDLAHLAEQHVQAEPDSKVEYDADNRGRNHGERRPLTRPGLGQSKQHLYHGVGHGAGVLLEGGLMDPCLLPETLMGLLKTTQPPMVVDVRKRLAFEADPAMLPGAVWRDPHADEQWAAELPRDVRSPSTACMAMR